MYFFNLNLLFASKFISRPVVGVACMSVYSEHFVWFGLMSTLLKQKISECEQQVESAI